MNVMRRRRQLPLLPTLGAVALAAASLCGAWAAESGSGPTAPPAAHGKDLFAAKCASCHGADLVGGEFGPRLTGPAFAGRWQGQAPEALSDFIRSRMPPSAPGTLGDDAAAELAAYIRQVNGAAASGLAEAAPAPRPAGAQASVGLTPPSPREAVRDPGLEQAKAARLAPLARLSPVTDAMLRRPADAD